MADREMRGTATTEKTVPTLSAAVRISVAQGLIEVTGTEKFVAAQLADTRAIQSLWTLAEKCYLTREKQIVENKKSAAEELYEQMVEDSKSAYDDAKEAFKMALKVIAEYQETQQQLLSKISQG